MSRVSYIHTLNDISNYNGFMTVSLVMRHVRIAAKFGAEKRCKSSFMLCIAFLSPT